MSDADGFEVKITALDDAEATYKAQGSAVTSYQGEFRSGASLPASAFGNLPQSGQLATQYEAFFKRVLNDMSTLSKALGDGGTKLAVAAKNYRKAERASTITD